MRPTLSPAGTLLEAPMAMPRSGHQWACIITCPGHHKNNKDDEKDEKDENDEGDEDDENGEDEPIST